jgi:hypothetical protein
MVFLMVLIIYQNNNNNNNNNNIVIIIIIVVVVVLLLLLTTTFADNIKIFCTVNLQLTVHSHNSICSWCAVNLILTKLKSSPLQGKIIQLIIFTHCVINTQLILNASKIWEFFGYCILYSSLKMLPLIQAFTYCFCTVDCLLLLLYFLLFRYKLNIIACLEYYDYWWQ